MTSLAPGLGHRGNDRIKTAVYQNGILSKDGISERLFALLFSGLVYPQIWEDPEIDMKALRLGESDRVIAIASGGCNIMSYLSRSPASIEAVDLNEAHVALNRLKLAAVRKLPAPEDFFRFFGEAHVAHNSHAYDRFIAPSLDTESRRYWEARRWSGKRRIDSFNGNFYRSGLLGLFIATAHLVAKLHGVDPSEIMQCRTIADQRSFFRERLAPVFDKPLIRLATSMRSSLFGLGIPPAQYKELAAAGDGNITTALKRRLEKLSCDFPLTENYFAWQAFARRYPAPSEGMLPPYLQIRNFEAVRQAAPRVTVFQQNIIERMRDKRAGTLDCYVLLDAQDWMNDRQLNELWTEITRTGAPGARVIFRTAGFNSPLPGRVSNSLMTQWRYEKDISTEFCARDRSAIYGGFHLYEKIL
jgi:S-adenosylmethionine-diacylglycerol 3-amino-3-carboxypropyl transferase